MTPRTQIPVKNDDIAPTETELNKISFKCENFKKKKIVLFIPKICKLPISIQ